MSYTKTTFRGVQEDGAQAGTIPNSEIHGHVVGGVDLNSAEPGVVCAAYFSLPVGGTVNLTKKIPAGRKFRVIGVRGTKTVQTGAAGDTVTVTNGGTAITDAISLNVADKTSVKELTIDDANATLDGDSAHVLVAEFNNAGGKNEAELYVLLLRLK